MKEHDLTLAKYLEIKSDLDTEDNPPNWLFDYDEPFPEVKEEEMYN